MKQRMKESILNLVIIGAILLFEVARVLWIGC